MALLSRLDAISEFSRNYIRDRKSLAFSEHTLIKALGEAGLFDNLTSKDSMLLLFQKHFLCMHVLYNLQEEFFEKGFYLNINPLAIYLEEISAAANASAPGTSQLDLRAYYQNLDTLLEATADSVNALQQDFFQRYTAWLESDDAYRTLELKSDASWRDIQAQYRRLIHNAHPDRGGEAAQFQSIKQAYEQLKLRHKR